MPRSENRKSIEIPADLHADLSAAAAKNGQKLTDVIALALWETATREGWTKTESPVGNYNRFTNEAKTRIQYLRERAAIETQSVDRILEWNQAANKLRNAITHVMNQHYNELLETYEGAISAERQHLIDSLARHTTTIHK